MSLEEIKDILSRQLKLDNLSTSELNQILSSISKYCKSKGTNTKMLTNSLEKTVLFLSKLNFTNDEILKMIGHGPFVLETNKNDLLAKYLVLAVLKDNKTGELIRRDTLIYYPKYYLVGISTLYARYKFLTEKSMKVTKWYLLKMTNYEFKSHCGIKHEELLKKYPYDESKLDELFSIPGNEEIREAFVS